MQEEQWYMTNPGLFEAEKAGMRKHYPGAKLGYLKDGRAYWALTLSIKIDNKITPWSVMLVYDSDHPNNKNFGGSCKAYPIKPPIKEIIGKAKRFGKTSVPHIVSASRNANPDDGPYLCTARKSDVKDGVNEVSSAVTTVLWTAKWAYFYEIGLYDSEVWKEFCGNGFFNLRIASTAIDMQYEEEIEMLKKSKKNEPKIIIDPNSNCTGPYMLPEKHEKRTNTNEGTYVNNIDLKNVGTTETTILDEDSEMEGKETVLRVNGNSTVTDPEFAGVADSEEAKALREAIKMQPPVFINPDGTINIEAMRAKKVLKCPQKNNLNKTGPGLID